MNRDANIMNHVAKVPIMNKPKPKPKRNRIAECRKELSLTQLELCDAIGDGWKQSRLGMYEIGGNQPSLDDCRKIVAGLNSRGGQYILDDVFPPSEIAAKPDATEAA